MSKRSKAAQPEDLASNIAYHLVDLARAYRSSFDKEMLKLGLDRSQWPLLINLWYHDGVTQQELADMREMTRGGMNKLIDRLEAAGYVRRAEGPDRRSKRVFIADDKRPLVAKIDQAQKKMIAQSLTDLSAAEEKALMQMLKKVRDRIG